MCLDRAFADHQSFRDFAIRLTLRDTRADLALKFGQSTKFLFRCQTLCWYKGHRLAWSRILFKRTSYRLVKRHDAAFFPCIPKRITKFGAQQVHISIIFAASIGRYMQAKRFT